MRVMAVNNGLYAMKRGWRPGSSCGAVSLSRLPTAAVAHPVPPRGYNKNAEAWEAWCAGGVSRGPVGEVVARLRTS
jgi:hypothetical protein